MKKALIIGATGQDGSYLAEYLLSLNYYVHGTKRKSSSFNTARIDHLINNKHYKFKLHYLDLSDQASIINLLNSIKPDEIYNLAAQSHVAVSFEMPLYTADIDALGTIRILEGIRICNLTKKTKFYQASTSELFGKVQEIPQKESTPFYPRSPYAVSKLFSYWSVVNYRESYNMFACNGILFNHESPRRGETFVTKKITRGLVRVCLGKEKFIELGNIYAKRDWGHAKDYVEMQHLMLQQEKPKDYVIATGRQYTVKQFINLCCKELGIRIKWSGKGLKEKATYISGGSNLKIKKDQVIIKVSKKYFRPSEVDTLLGDSSLAKKYLKWTPKIGIEQLVSEMIAEDLKIQSSL